MRLGSVGGSRENNNNARLRALSLSSALLAATTLLPSAVIAHPDGLYGEGCHNNRRTGVLHVAITEGDFAHGCFHS